MYDTESAQISQAQNICKHVNSVPSRLYQIYQIKKYQISGKWLIMTRKKREFVDLETVVETNLEQSYGKKLYCDKI